MALKATIYKIDLDVVDMDRNYYAEHRLTIARHPSETDEWMMLRVLAFALNASERLEFGKGISDSDEPDLWLKDYAGDVELWIELGQPDERVVAKACKRAKAVAVYAFSARPALWWEPARAGLSRFRNLTVWHVDPKSAKALAAMAAPTASVQVTVQDGEAWARDGRGAEVRVELSRLA
mgnify:CR=1 FL=1